MSSRNGGPRSPLEHFVNFCSKLRLEDGQPLELYPEQRDMLADYFAGVRETLILIPKKNGKTTLLAALGLFHLTTTTNAACFIGAASRDQASILFEQATGFIRRTDWLQKYVDVKAGYREIRSTSDAGKLRVLAADANTADGVLPTLALVDELHRHKNSDLYAVFRDGLPARSGQMLTISTAGDDESSPLGKLRRAAHSLPSQKRKAMYRYASKSGFAMHEWALGPDDDRDDLDLVVQANPAPWQTKEALRERLESPSTRPWEWARFACGVWVAGEESAISEREWRACVRDGVAIPKGTEDVFVGVDLGWKHDHTAFVPIYRPAGDALVHTPTILVPPGDGEAIDSEEIWAVVEQMSAYWPQVTFVLDPEAGGEQLAQRIDRELPGARVATHSQKTSPMCLAAQRLSEAIAAQRIHHPDDPMLNSHVLAAAAKQIGPSWKFVKPRKKDMKIDALVALAMAHSSLVGGESAEDNSFFVL